MQKKHNTDINSSNNDLSNGCKHTCRTLMDMEIEERRTFNKMPIQSGRSKVKSAQNTDWGGNISIVKTNVRLPHI